jgi:hypothetical protein
MVPTGLDRSRETLHRTHANLCFGFTRDTESTRTVRLRMHDDLRVFAGGLVIAKTRALRDDVATVHADP